MSEHLVAVLGRGVLDPDEPAVTADDLGLSRGDGCFDSLRVVTDATGTSTPVALDEHLDRLDSSARALAIDGPPRQAWRELVAEALAAWTRPGEATLRLVLTRGREWRPGPATALVTLSPVARGPDRGGQARGLTAVTLTRGHPSDAFVDAPWLLGGVKTLAYAVNVAARREALARGADDAVFTTTDGFALDGPTSGLLVARGGALLSTPVEGTGILASTMVARVLAGAAEAGLEARYELVPVVDLYTADGVWLLASSRGPSPVTRLDGRDLAVDAALVAAVARLSGF